MVFKSLGGKKASIEYQLKNKTAKVLFGDPKLIQQQIDASSFSQTYCGMILSFEEEISPQVENEILESLIKVIHGGLDGDALSILVVRHTDKLHKGKVRRDYHITTVETELQTRKHITIYEHIKDHAIFYAWERMINIKYCLSRPDDPARRHTITIPKKLGKDRKQQLAVIDGFMIAEAKAGNIQNRSDVIRLLKRAGLSVPREGKDYITIEDKDGNRTRLKGLFYERGFTIERITERARGTPTSPDSGDAESLGDAEKRLSKLFAGRVSKFYRLYRRNRETIEMADPARLGNDGVGNSEQFSTDGGEPQDRPSYESPSGGASPANRNRGPLLDIAARTPGASRESDHSPEPYRNRTQKDGVTHEKQSDGVGADILEQFGKLDARSRAAAERTTAVLRATTAAMGATSRRVDNASSGFAEAVANFVQIATALDRAIKFARNPLEFLARFIMRLLLPRPNPPRIPPPSIS